MNNILSYKGFALYFGNYVFSVLEEYNYIVNIRAFAHVLGILVFLEVCTYKALLPVHIQFGIGHRNLNRLNGLKVAYLSQARVFIAVFLLEFLEVVNCIGYKVGKVVLHHLHLCLKLGNLLVYNFHIKLGDLAYRFFNKFQDIIHDDWAQNKILELQHLLVHIIKLLLPSAGLLFQDAVHLVLKEDLLQ